MWSPGKEAWRETPPIVTQPPGQRSKALFTRTGNNSKGFLNPMDGSQKKCYWHYGRDSSSLGGTVPNNAGYMAPVDPAH